jgi:hypothetical protein
LIRRAISARCVAPALRACGGFGVFCHNWKSIRFRKKVKKKSLIRVGLVITIQRLRHSLFSGDQPFLRMNLLSYQKLCRCGTTNLQARGSLWVGLCPFPYFMYTYYHTSGKTQGIFLFFLKIFLCFFA